MKIGQLLDSIKHQDLVLPEFQREYVWTKDQAKQLMVSLFKDYPTGGLLFWTTDNPPELKNVDIPEDRIGTTQVMLDGQQRLTTLYLLLRNEIPPFYQKNEIKNDPRKLYFNLETCEFKYYQPTMQDNSLWIKLVECFDPTNQINVIDIAQMVIIPEESAKNQMEYANKLQDNLFKLKLIKEKDYTIQNVPVSANVDEAIDIFDRVNSQGTKLTDADLALAHICGKWPQARQEMKEKISKLKEKDFNFDLVFMTRSLTSIINGRAMFDTVHNTSEDDLKVGWNKLSKILDYLVNILPAHAHIDSTEDISSTNILVPLIVYLANNEMKFKDQQDMKSFIHWIYAAHMWGRYSSQTDQMLDKDISIVLRSGKPFEGLISEIIEDRGRIDVKPSDIEGKWVFNPLFNIAYIVSKSKGAVDWCDGTPLGKTFGESYSIQKHHIFPKSLLYKPKGPYSGYKPEDKQIVNEIANRAFITRNSNFEISNRKPSTYLAKIKEKYPGELEKQFIPLEPELWELNRYEDFLIKRRELIANGINRLMKDLITEKPITEPKTVDYYRKIGENDRIEFKSSLRWDLYQKQPNKKLEGIIVKSISGFMNTNGGTLLIGVSDDGSILGIENDIESLNRKDLDGFQQRLIQIIDNYIGTIFTKYIHINFEDLDGRTVCIMKIETSPRKPVYFKDKESEEFYIRAGNTTRPLKRQDTVDYIKNHFID